MKNYIFITIISVFILSLFSCGRTKVDNSYGQDQLERNADFIASLREDQIIPEATIDREVSPETIRDTLFTKCVTRELEPSRFYGTNDDLPKIVKRTECNIYALPKTQLATFVLIRVQKENNDTPYWVSVPYIMPISRQYETGMLRLKAKLFYNENGTYIALVPTGDN